MSYKLLDKILNDKYNLNLNDLLKKYTEDKKIYSDLVKLRELVDEQDKLLDVE